MNIGLKGQTAVVFGAGRGIGEAIVTQLARVGAMVYVADHITGQALNIDGGASMVNNR